MLKTEKKYPKRHCYTKAKYENITLKCNNPKCGKEFAVYERQTRVKAFSKNYCSNRCVAVGMGQMARKIGRENALLKTLDEPINDPDLEAVEEFL